MGMSTHVVGFKPPDAKWKKMKAIWDACQAADEEVPENVSTFFNDESPDESGVEVELTDKEGVEEWDDSNSCSGYQIEIAKLPKDVKFVRIYNSW